MTYTDTDVTAAAQQLARVDGYRPPKEALAPDILTWWRTKAPPSRWVRTGFLGGVTSVCDLGDYEARVRATISALG